MKSHSAFRFLPVLILATVLGAGTAAAQDADDFSFAKRLAYRGWYDLAADVCARIEKDTSLPRDVRSALPILHAEIELAKADREQDPDKALKYISESITRLQTFIAEETNHPRIFEAHINIGYLKMRKAKALIDQMEGARLAADHDRLKKEAAALYAEVTTGFEESVANWKRLAKSNEVDGAIMDARLEADRARYENAKIPGLPDLDKKKLLEDAVKNLVDFEIDYGDTAKAFEAMLLEGRCLFELGEFAQAETKLKNTLSIIGVLRKAGIPRNPYFDQIIYGSYLTLAQVYLRTNRPPVAQAFIDGVFASDPAAERDWIGLALKVEKVEALYRRKETVLAKQLAEKVIEADPNGFFAKQMREKLEKLNRGGTNRIDPDSLVRIAEGNMEKGRPRDALMNLRQAIENCTTEEARNKTVPKALYLMGQCLQDLRRPLEAAIVFEKVVNGYSKHELGVKACWEAIVCYSNEFDTFEDPADEQQKDRLMEVLLDRFKGAKEGDNVPYLQGLKLENARKLLEAAEKYLKVPERAPAYERSLVRGAYCLRVDAFRRFADFVKQGKKDPAFQQSILDQLNRAEGLFKTFLGRLTSHPVEGEAFRDRASLVLVVNQELAFLYNHELVGKAPEALAFLEKVAKDIPADDERMAKIHLLQIQSQLVLLRNEEAVKTIEMMFDRFPHAKETAQACKSVAIRLDEITARLVEEKGDPKVIEENLKKISRYYGKWLKGVMAFGMDARVTDVLSVAETLYMAAKRLNNIPDTVLSFMDMKKGIVGWKNYFEDAGFVHSLLVEKYKGKYSEKDRLTLMERRARCLSFIADNSEIWLHAKTAYEEVVREFNVIDAKGAFVPATLIARPVLLGVYLEFASTYAELGRWHKIHYDNAISHFANIANVTAHGSEPWWIARFMSLQCHYLRGKDKDILTAQIGVKMIQDNYPDFDGGKYGLKDRFIDLKKKIETGR